MLTIAVPIAAGEEVVTLTEAITQGGAVAVLLLLLYYFIKGEIFTKSMLTKTLEVLSVQWSKSLEEAITRALTAARAQWREEVLDYARKTSQKLDNLPCVAEKGHEQSGGRKDSQQSEKEKK